LHRAPADFLHYQRMRAYTGWKMDPADEWSGRPIMILGMVNLE
jgi:hypothetical protein